MLPWSRLGPARNGERGGIAWVSPNEHELGAAMIKRFSCVLVAMLLVAFASVSQAATVFQNPAGNVYLIRGLLFQSKATTTTSRLRSAASMTRTEGETILSQADSPRAPKP